MRLFLLPISTRRTLLYCQKLQALPSEKRPLVDKITLRAAKLWAGWEKKDGGWQKAVVKYGNRALRRVPYEEWGLKSVPTLSARRREEEVLGKEKHHLIFPETVIPADRAPQVLRTLATERESLHRSRILWCLVGMPITAPFALIPIIPNLPFFYLVYRAWSHYRAIAGGKHLQWLLTKGFFTTSPSQILDEIYSQQHRSTDLLEEPNGSGSQSSDSRLQSQERLLLSQERGRTLAQALKIPELGVELERAIWQVETAIRKQEQQGEKTKYSSTEKQDGP
ncbi:mitochondrial K+-H+ exchange-related-domain-containing protein [Xylaria bambusicola]|uniref:mitochondrial K+-H+ exchange-related-domain-containing protein n=1 Tax=Xylaria bambusicola TaxID=326684 RepID=UPI0020083B89|nr:mitochondrial K+-H+ exchange-related-domain-containing protein [Xylaria bambusicola]KAI0508353.1 mitochondrial K+-H+ exchange-related-domain-containing protein [Xylaria bambusicola]